MKMAAWRWLRQHKPSWFGVFIVLLLVAVTHYLLAPAYGVELSNRAINLTSNEAGATSTYNLVFNLPAPDTIGSITIQFCSNDPFPEDPCVAPAGFDDSAAVLTAQTGATGFTISPATTANDLVLTRPPTLTPAGVVILNFDGVINPSSPGSYYARVQTFATADASGPASSFGGIVMYIASQIGLNATVPPYLLFCTGITISNQNCANAVGDYIDFGELSTTQALTATSQMLAATNAQGGYNVTMDGTTLTSGNNAITGLNPGDVSRPGTAQFGFNLRANTTPNTGNTVFGPGTTTPAPLYDQANTYRFNPGDIVATTDLPDDIRVYTSSYIVNVPKTQAAGVYVSTVTYICLANF